MRSYLVAQPCLAPRFCYYFYKRPPSHLHTSLYICLPAKASVAFPTDANIRPPVSIRANLMVIDETALSLARAYLFSDFPSLVLPSNCWKTTRLNQPETPCWTHDRGRLLSSWNSSTSSSCLKTATTLPRSKTCTLSTTCSYTVKTA